MKSPLDEFGMRNRAKVAAGATLMFVAKAAFCQSCALCYSQAAQSGGRFISALRSGIIVLIIPPMFMSIGITWLAYRKRNTFRSVGSGEDDRESLQDGFDE